MDVFDDEFQEYISWKMGAACETIEDKNKWKEINDEYDTLHDIIFNSLNEEQQKSFNEFMHSVWEKVGVELCVVYKIGMTDRKELNKYVKKIQRQSFNEFLKDFISKEGAK